MQNVVKNYFDIDDFKIDRFLKMLRNLLVVAFSINFAKVEVMLSLEISGS